MLCPEDCKSLKDSGKSAADLANVAVVEYVGTGTNSASVTVDFVPLFAVVYDEDNDTNNYVGILTPNGGFVLRMTRSATSSTEGEATPHFLSSEVSGNSLSWECPYTSSYANSLAFNTKNHNYKAFVVGRA